MPAFAERVDLKILSASCPQMAAQLERAEKRLNSVKMEDREFLRVRLKEYQALSRASASSKSCRQVLGFFKAQAESVRNLIRNRAVSTTAKAQQKQVQQQKFISDMNNLQVALSTINQGLAQSSELAPTPKNPSSSRKGGQAVYPVLANNCIRTRKDDFHDPVEGSSLKRWIALNKCSKDVVIFFCRVGSSAQCGDFSLILTLLSNTENHWKDFPAEYARVPRRNGIVMSTQADRESFYTIAVTRDSILPWCGTYLNSC